MIECVYYVGIMVNIICTLLVFKLNEVCDVKFQSAVIQFKTQSQFSLTLCFDQDISCNLPDEILKH